MSGVNISGYVSSRICRSERMLSEFAPALGLNEKQVPDR